MVESSQNNYVVEHNGKKYVFGRLIEAMSFSKKYADSKELTLDFLPVNTIYDLAANTYEELKDTQYDMENINAGFDKLVSEVEKQQKDESSTWVTIPKGSVGKVFEQADKNGKNHEYVFVNIPTYENERMSFTVFSKQVLQHPVVKDLAMIPISVKGIIASINKFIDGKWTNTKEYQNISKDDAVKMIKDKFKNINNKGTKYIHIKKENCKVIKSDESYHQGQMYIKLPNYMKEHDGFDYSNANMIVNKVYQLTKPSLEGMVGIQCVPDHKFICYSKDINKSKKEIDALTLYKYHKEDFKELDGAEKNYYAGLENPSEESFNPYKEALNDNTEVKPVDIEEKYKNESSEYASTTEKPIEKENDKSDNEKEGMEM